MKDLKAAARAAITYLEAYERWKLIPPTCVHQPRDIIGRLKAALKRADAKSVQPTQSVGQDAEAMTYRDGVWRIVDHKYGLLTPDREATIRAQVDAFLARDPAP